jgi:hypothetical protein
MEKELSRKMKRAHDGVFVVHCSSAAWQPHFQEFLKGSLGLRHYGLLAIPGGVQSLTLPDLLPKFAWAGWRWIKFLADIDDLGRIVLMGHEDCRWYQRGPITRFVESERKRQESDLRQSARSFQERLPHAKVNLYFAHMAQAKAVFDAIG